MNTARAAVLIEPRRFELLDVALPEATTDSALLRVEAAGVCGSDLEYFVDSEVGRSLRPIIPGHENVGIVENIGDAASSHWGVRDGDRVVVEEFIPCRTCEHCLRDRYTLCSQTDFRRADQRFLRYGRTSFNAAPSLWGGFSEILYIHPNAIVHKVSHHVLAERAVLFVPIANGLRWLREIGRVKGNESVLIIGPGQHGLGCVVAATALGLKCVLVAGTTNDAARLEVASSLGASEVIVSDGDGDGGDLVTQVSNLTDGRGVDLVVDVTPAADVLSHALACVSPGGVVVFAGNKSGRRIAITPDIITRKEITVRGVQGSNRSTIPEALRIIESDLFPLELMCGTSVGLEATEATLQRMVDLRGSAPIHVSIVPNR